MNQFIYIDWDFNNNPSLRRWNNKFNSLEKYFLKNGSVHVPKDDIHNNPLREWVIRQRRDYKRGVLTCGQLEKLKSLRFKFEIDDNWDTRMADLAAFKNKYGHCCVPQKIAQFKSLAIFSSNVRQKYKKGKLEEDKKQALLHLGFEWDVQDGLWCKAYEDLKAFLNENDWADLAKKNSKLYNFCNTNRTERRKGILSDERINFLTVLGLEWEPIAGQWIKMFRQLVDYYKKNGTARVTLTDRKTEILRKWCYTQRSSHRNKLLKPEQFGLLQTVDFDWVV